MNKWPQSVLNNLDLFFPTRPLILTANRELKGFLIFPITSGSSFIRVFGLQDYKRYENFDECVEYIEECMIEHAPIDGLLGFSQGAILSAALAGLQAKVWDGIDKSTKIGFLMIISGAKLINEALAEKAYSPPIQCPSLHFLGDKRFHKATWDRTPEIV
ncbi:putative serine hydrolase FSH, alpha/Beta hydrolase [Helianthus annuus]|nr:putative serine hydrolase FSH, alpha/Beta hydrolase [Helianthus annuus]